MSAQQLRQRAGRDNTIALVVYNHVPDGCHLHLIPDNAHWPVLRTGEHAVVDTTQREIEFDQLYSIRQSNGPRVWQVSRSLYKTIEPCVMLHPLNRPGSMEEIDQIIADAQEMVAPGSIPIVPLNLSDGPIRLDGFVEKRVIGRVIGVYQAEDVSLPAIGNGRAS